MKFQSFVVWSVWLTSICLSSSATDYTGNLVGGGPIGTGGLTLTDNGTTISGTLTRGVGLFNDVFVIYIDSVPSSGFASTALFADGGDILRKAVSGFDGLANRSVMTFDTAFSPDYAIALGPSSAGFGALYQLANGLNLTAIHNVGLTPTSNNATTYSFSFDWSQIGLAGTNGASFELFGTYMRTDGRSREALPGDDTGVDGWNPFLQTAFGTYSVVPEPSPLGLFSLAALGGLIFWRWFRWKD